MIERSQDPQDILLYEANFRPHCVRYRLDNAFYSTGVVVEPLVGTGFQYKATVGGWSGTAEPRWPKTAGQTLKDGAITWTCETRNGDSLERSMTGATWTGTGLTIGTPTNDTTSSKALISGGVLGQSYEVSVVATFNDTSRKTVAFTLKIERPRVIE
jgi:hypothetical protein